MTEHPHIKNMFPPIAEPSWVYHPRPMCSVGFSQERLKPSPGLIEKRDQLADQPSSTLRIANCTVCGAQNPIDHSDAIENMTVNTQTGRKEICWDKCPVCRADLFYAAFETFIN